MPIKSPIESLKVNPKLNTEYLFKENAFGNSVVGYKDMYKFYKNCGLRDKPVTYKLYVEILKFVFLKIWWEIITNIWRFKMPFKLGSIYVVDKVGCSPKYKDWVDSKEKGEGVKRYNMHTKGHRFRFKWNKSIGGPKHLLLYNMYVCRFEYTDDIAGSRGLARWIKKCAADPLMKDFKAHLD